MKIFANFSVKPLQLKTKTSQKRWSRVEGKSRKKTGPTAWRVDVNMDKSADRWRFLSLRTQLIGIAVRRPLFPAGEKSKHSGPVPAFQCACISLCPCKSPCPTLLSGHGYKAGPRCSPATLTPGVKVTKWKNQSRREWGKRRSCKGVQNAPFIPCREQYHECTAKKTNSTTNHPCWQPSATATAVSCCRRRERGCTPEWRQSGIVETTWKSHTRRVASNILKGYRFVSKWIL